MGSEQNLIDIHNLLISSNEIRILLNLRSLVSRVMELVAAIYVGGPSIDLLTDETRKSEFVLLAIKERA